MTQAPAPFDLAYVWRSVDAAFDLVVRDKRAWQKLDLTTEGFYRSFAAMLIVLPLHILVDVIASQLAVAEGGSRAQREIEQAYGLGDAVFSTVALCMQWLLFPVAMLFLLRHLQLAHRYAALIIAHNWASVVVLLFNLPAFLLYAAGVIDSRLAVDLNLIVLGFALYYRFYIAQTALDTHWTLAAAIAAIDFLLQLNFLFVLSKMSGLWLPGAS